jgi:hypothetical protein
MTDRSVNVSSAARQRDVGGALDVRCGDACGPRGAAVGPGLGQTGDVIASHLLGGRYRLEEPIGQGGMSVVWRALDEVLSRPVAIKVLDERGAGAGPDLADGGRATIRHEAQSAARISHPHIANVYDFAEGVDSDGNPVAYLVMELLTGQPLSDRLLDGELPAASALTIAAEVAAALAAAHEYGLVHRDVKPGNIMLTPFGVKVFDFGIAASAGDPDEADERGQILGTPMYVAPERLTGAAVTAAADMYAFGVLLEQLLGTRLADRPEVEQLQRRCVDRDPAGRPPASEAADLLRTASSTAASSFLSPTLSLSALPSSALPSSAVPTSPVPSSPSSPSPLPSSTVPVPTSGFPRGVAAVRTEPRTSAATSLMSVDRARPGLPRVTLVATAVALIVAGLATVIAVSGAGSGTGTGTDRPTPATTPATSAPAPATAAHSAVLPSSAASVTAACAGTQATITGYTLQTGFELHKANRGPATVVTAEFRSTGGHGRSKSVVYTITCRDGVPSAHLSTDN